MNMHAYRKTLSNLSLSDRGWNQGWASPAEPVQETATPAARRRRVVLNPYRLTWEESPWQPGLAFAIYYHLLEVILPAAEMARLIETRAAKAQCSVTVFRQVVRQLQVGGKFAHPRPNFVPLLMAAMEDVDAPCPDLRALKEIMDGILSTFIAA